jgi:hypothetical protein
MLLPNALYALLDYGAKIRILDWLFANSQEGYEPIIIGPLINWSIQFCSLASFKENQSIFAVV